MLPVWRLLGGGPVRFGNAYNCIVQLGQREIGYGEPKVAFYHRFSIRNKHSVQALIDTVSSWKVRRIIMSHGDIVESDDAAQLFAAAWARFAD